MCIDMGNPFIEWLVIYKCELTVSPLNFIIMFHNDILESVDITHY